ncbi:hypothetical protein BDW72DRAFT_141352 [Aspergillus terricola var. indicus]
MRRRSAGLSAALNQGFALARNRIGLEPLTREVLPADRVQNIQYERGSRVHLDQGVQTTPTGSEHGVMQVVRALVLNVQLPMGIAPDRCEISRSYVPDSAGDLILVPPSTGRPDSLHSGGGTV